MVLFLVPYNRVLSYRTVKPAELVAEGLHISQSPSMKSGLLLKSWCAGMPVSFAYYDCYIVRTSLDSIQKKNQYIGPLHGLQSAHGLLTARVHS